MYKTARQALGISIYSLEILFLCLVPIASAAPPQNDAMQFEILNSLSPKLPLNPFLYPSAPRAPVQIAWPEHYIAPTVEYALSLVLPQPIQETLVFQPGYDRQTGLPTLLADWFVPVRMDKRRSFFVNSRLSMTAQRESVSVAAGFRRELTSNLLLGFNVFHDWVRARGSDQQFLMQAGAGMEIEALPGWYSDLSLSANVYLPVNERYGFNHNDTVFVRESLPLGADARVGLRLPGVIDLLDARVDAEVHSYRGESIDVAGYGAGISVAGRDGIISASCSTAKERAGDGQIKIDAKINLLFDWAALQAGANPFSAPHPRPGPRYGRAIKESLSKRTARKQDMPVDRIERTVALHTRVIDDMVSFCGAFPGLPNARLAVQTSQSPWSDYLEVTTDSKGFYLGRVKLPPGTYKLRLVHKPTGRESNESTVEIK